MPEMDYVVFYRLHTGGYYKYNGNFYEVSQTNINLLKETLSIPFKLEFKGFSRAQVSRIIGDLRSNDMTIRIVKPNNGGFAVKFLERKKEKNHNSKIKAKI